MEWANSLRARQIKAARALLDWSQDDLAGASNLSVATIRKLELGHISPRGRTSNLIRRALEDAGLEFLEPDGVRHRPEDIAVYQGFEGVKDFFDEVYHTAKRKGCDIVIVSPSERAHFSGLLRDYTPLHMERMTTIRETTSVKIILTEDKDYLPATSYVEYRWISKGYVDSVPFYVYDDRYAIITFDADLPKITVIRSRVIASAFLRQFHSMWDKATPLNKIQKKPVRG